MKQRQNVMGLHTVVVSPSHHKLVISDWAEGACGISFQVLFFLPSPDPRSSNIRLTWFIANEQKHDASIFFLRQRMKQVDVNDAGHQNNGLQTWFLKSLFYDIVWPFWTYSWYSYIFYSISLKNESLVWFAYEFRIIKGSTIRQRQLVITIITICTKLQFIKGSSNYNSLPVWVWVLFTLMHNFSIEHLRDIFTTCPLRDCLTF